MKSIVVLVSGNGSNLQAIIDACETSINNGKVTAVFSNKATAYALERAKKAGAAGVFLDPKSFDTRDAFDHELMKQIDEYSPDLIVLAGYMRILSGEFVRHYMGRMINIHPSLLPKYPGLNTYQRAIHAGDEEHGTSVHFVTEQLDGGPVILQAKVPIFDDDTIDTLTERVQTQEYKIYPLVVEWFVNDRLEMRGGKAFLDGKQLGIHGYASE
ncbi:MULTISPECIES: phosphoribosylglycinamide formyltransferase [Vibrio]|uniref:Phosphoribosylglycinamide formyltransferase n=1 Tax=Vibrio proteolyticus NBRC 13287 TaxID=1219065 RepID=U3BMP3_VIBPR|nr:MULTISPECIES: phosphoribosylglycinamide formyltransferase [Vibrio]NAW58428.1 phosphoribosylglycinamide formyltransferase [Vibrio sp. V36_P2S2PM302]NAX21886.1 phosphoribosylglycinamide formyltransferase [Vibrio sp. V39_P1S14PM300]NAX24653.1 phosphoribosylglycinamide formyltransferase [Vibrio sp. V38_P2S17PM301]NAX31302.1 phosphoribosylglycinamide formyltransferase [Vibrio sp. V37_P2S8PM304]GAD67843.1 phosphoribosylglycinamide formyltransferase [Vibrio proteolyticus NBRC 13287]